MKKITILIPAYNEEEVLPNLFARLGSLQHKLNTYNLEYLFVNDGSKDRTLDKIKDEAYRNKNISFISLSRNFGKEIGMIAGLDYAKDSDAVVIIDADLQDPPELIPEMVRYWEEGYDDVYARRRSRAGESWLKKKPQKLFTECCKNRHESLYSAIQGTFDY